MKLAKKCETNKVLLYLCIYITAKEGKLGVPYAYSNLWMHRFNVLRGKLLLTLYFLYVSDFIDKL